MMGDHLRLFIAMQKEFQVMTHNMSLSNDHSKTVQNQLRSIHEEVGFNRGDVANGNASEEGQFCFCNLISLGIFKLLFIRVRSDSRLHEES